MKKSLTALILAACTYTTPVDSNKNTDLAQDTDIVDTDIFPLDTVIDSALEETGDTDRLYVPDCNILQIDSQRPVSYGGCQDFRNFPDCYAREHPATAELHFDGFVTVSEDGLTARDVIAQTEILFGMYTGNGDRIHVDNAGIHEAEIEPLSDCVGLFNLINVGPPSLFNAHDYTNALAEEVSGGTYISLEDNQAVLQMFPQQGALWNSSINVYGADADLTRQAGLVLAHKDRDVRIAADLAYNAGLDPTTIILTFPGVEPSWNTAEISVYTP